MPVQPGVSGDPDAQRTWIKPYYRGFNGLRGIAVLTVFAGHYAGYTAPDAVSPTYLAISGVILFFVLSGFLITGILYDSLEGPRFFRTFYIRRALRILPLFYGFFLLLFLLTPLLHLRYTWTLLSFPLYVGNLVIPFTDLSPVHYLNPTQIRIFWQHRFYVQLANIGHLWTLCVEEQFYLVWPAIVWWMRDRRRLMRLCVWLFFGSLALRVLLRYSLSEAMLATPLIYWGTLTRCDALLAGAWMALWLRGRTLSLRQLRRTARGWALIPGMAFVAGIALCPPTKGSELANDPFLCTLGFSLIALSAAGLILHSMDETGWLMRILAWRPLYGLGVISYGFYFVHLLPQALLDQYAVRHPHFKGLVAVVALAITLLVSILSYRYYETPFLRLKSRFAPKSPLLRHGSDDADADFSHVTR